MLATQAVVDRIGRASAAFMTSWLEIAAGAGDARGVEVHRVGEAVAACAPGAPDVDFLNTVHHLRRPEDVAGVASLYREHGVTGHAEIPPGHGVAELTAALTAEGARQQAFYSWLAGPVITGAPVDGVEVQEVGFERVQEFAEAILRGHEVPEAAFGTAIPDHVGWLGRPGWSLWLAEVDGEVAGAAALAISGDRTAYLANASTLPSHRRRGVQGALINARLAVAEREGCDFACSLTSFDSTSQRNLERAGLSVACTAAQWIFPFGS